MQTNQVERYLKTSNKPCHIEDVAAGLDLTYEQASCALKRLKAAGRIHKVRKGIYSSKVDAEVLANRFLRTPAGQRLA